MKVGAPARIAAVAVLLALGLVALVVREGVARAQGQEAVLAINAYDPRSPLGGHYVAFQLRDALPAGSPCPPGARSPAGRPFARQPTTWVALKRVGDRHRVAGAAPSRGQAQQWGELAVRGEFSCDTGFVGRDVPEARIVSLDIGVTRFHADQRQAEAIERALRQAGGGPEPQALAVVSVGRDGKARLKGVIVGGRRTDLTWF